MQKLNLKDITLQVIEVAKETATFIRGEVGKVKDKDINDKAVNSLVSYVDITAEKQIVAALRKIVPQAGFITEEGTTTQEIGEEQKTNEKESELEWVIDPLDGTTNFLYNVPSFAVSIALKNTQEVLIGVVVEVNREECFYAWKEGGAFLNGKKIRVNKNTELIKAMIATGFLYSSDEGLDDLMKVLKHFIVHARGVRRLGAAAIDLCYVACGKFDAFYEYGLNPWDVAAGGLIVQEAGGVVTDFSGTYEFLFGRQLLASSAAIRPEVFKVIKKHLQTQFQPQ